MEWIDVKDQMPDDMTAVLVHIVRGWQGMRRDEVKIAMHVLNHWEIETGYVAHWMPIPELPNEG